MKFIKALGIMILYIILLLLLIPNLVIRIAYVLMNKLSLEIRLMIKLLEGER